MSEFFDTGSAFQFQIPDSSEPGNPEGTHPIIAPHFRAETFFADFEKWVRNLYRCTNWHKCLHADLLDGYHASAFQLACDKLASICALAGDSDQMIYLTGPDTFATTNLTAFARTILDDADAATVRATIGAGTGSGDLVDDTSPQLGGDLDLNGNVITGLEIGTDVQAYNAETMLGTNNLSDVSDNATALTNLGILRCIVTSDFTNATTTMAAVTGMSVTAEASTRYQFEADILTTGASNGLGGRKGIKFDFDGGTATLTSTSYGYTRISTTTGTHVMEVTALSTDVVDSAAGIKRRYRIQGYIHTNGAGTVIMQIAAHSGSFVGGTAATVHTGSWMRFTKV